MEFVHRPYQRGETIAAIATPPGEGGVAIIRISGDKAIEVAEAVFFSAKGPVRGFKSHTARFGKIKDSTGKTIDEVLLLVMRAPKSYTGEETVEIHCHGGSLITRNVLRVVLEAGARAAHPGEFTFKAFINGKLDLAQAEAVQTLISARGEHALALASEQLEGALSRIIQTFQQELVDIAATLEAWVDFPEEGLAFASIQEICSVLVHIKEKMETLHNTFEQGKKLNEGVNLCLIGPPNAGKSSLMNALARKERAIVTDIPGTTRDILEEEIRLCGLPCKLLDTAGIRETTERIEQEGIQRSKKAMAAADLILLVLDITQPLTPAEHALIQACPEEKTLLIWNKKDLGSQHHPHLPFAHQAFISAKLGHGLEELINAIDKMIWKNGPPSKEEVILTNTRHKQALSGAIEACDKLIEGLHAQLSPEFLAADMRHILTELGTIIGTNITEDILSAIFSKFCIGK